MVDYSDLATPAASGPQDYSDLFSPDQAFETQNAKMPSVDDLKTAERQETTQKIQAQQQAIQQAQAKEAQANDPKNWSMEETKKRFKATPSSGPEDDAQRAVILENKKSQIDDIKNQAEIRQAPPLNEQQKFMTPGEKWATDAIGKAVKSIGEGLGLIETTAQKQAKVQNILALSKIYDLPASTIEANYRQYTQKIVKSDPTSGQLMAAISLPPIAAGLAMAPVATGATLAVFAGLGEIENAAVSAVKGEKYQFMRGRSAKDLLPKEATETTKDLVDLLDMFGKGFAAHGITTGSPELAQRWTKDFVTNYKLPEKVYVSSEKLGAMSTDEFQTFFQKEVGLSAEQTKEMWIAKQQGRGVEVELPAEKVVMMVDKPWWGKVKDALGVKKTGKVMSSETAGEGGVVRKGLPAPDQTSQQAPSPELTPPVTPEPQAQVSPSEPIPPTSIEPGKSVPSEPPALPAPGFHEAEVGSGPAIYFNKKSALEDAKKYGGKIVSTDLSDNPKQTWYMIQSPDGKDEWLTLRPDEVLRDSSGAIKNKPITNDERINYELAQMESLKKASLESSKKEPKPEKLPTMVQYILKNYGGITSKSLKQNGIDLRYLRESGRLKVVRNKGGQFDVIAKDMGIEPGVLHDMIIKNAPYASPTSVKADRIMLDEIDRAGKEHERQKQEEADAEDMNASFEDISTFMDDKGQLTEMPIVDDVAQVITDTAQFLAESAKGVEPSNDISWALGKVKTAGLADEIRAVKFLKGVKLPENIEQVLHWKENPNEPITPEQLAFYTQYVKPLQDASLRIFMKAKKNGVPIDPETYSHREVAGKGGMVDRLKQGVKATGGLLSRSAPSFKHRVMHAAVSEDGRTRWVVAIKDGEVTALTHGNSFKLGDINMKSYEDLRDEEMKKIDDKEKALKTEYGILTKTESRMGAAQVRIRNIEQALQDLNVDRMGVIDKYSPHNLDNKVFIDKSGGKWRIEQATVKEIEANSNVKYHKNILVNEMLNYIRLRKVERAMDFLDGLTKSPGFSTIGIDAEKAFGNSAYDGWKPSSLPQFRGKIFDPKVADTLDHFNKQMAGPDPLNALNALNGFLRTAIFFNPFIHVPNIGIHWIVNRGVTAWLLPKQYKTLVTSGLRAMHAVSTQSKDYIMFLEHGGNLKFSDTLNEGLKDQLMKYMGEELSRDTAIAQEVKKWLGWANPWKLSSMATWWVNDVAYMQAAYEEAERLGIPFEEAIRNVSKHIPDYRVPVRVMNSKMISNLLTNPLVTMFGSYHYGALRSYGEMTKSMLKGVGLKFPEGPDLGEAPKQETPAQEGFSAVDKAAALALVAMVLYPYVLDPLAKKLTGNKNAAFRRAGATTFPVNVWKYLKNKIDFWSLLTSVLTPAPGTKAVVEVSANLDLRTGKHVRGEGSEGLVDYAKTQVSPLDTAEKLKSGTMSPWSFIGIQTPKKVYNTDAEQMAANLSRESIPSKLMTEEQKAHYQKLNAIRDQYKLSKDRRMLSQAVREGHITDRDKKTIIKESAYPPIYEYTHRLSVVDMEKVIKVAKKDELPILKAIFKKKFQNKWKSTSGDDHVGLRALASRVRDEVQKIQERK